MIKNLEKLEDNQLKLTIELSKEEFDVFFEKALSEELKTYEAKGFRKGCVPKSIYLRSVGEQRVIMKCMDDAINDNYSNLLNEFDIKPIIEAEVEVISSPEEIKNHILKYTLLFTQFPTMEIGEYKNLNIEKDKDFVTDDEVNSYIDSLLAKKADWIVSEGGTLEINDTAVFDFEGFKNGVAFEGGKAENYNLVIGSNNFIPGFETQMVGMKSEEEKEINVTFPDDYQEPSLASCPVVFKVKLHEIKKKSVPQLTDEIVPTLIDLLHNHSKEELNLKTVDELKSYVTIDLNSHAKEECENKYLNDIMKKIASLSKFHIGSKYIEKVTESKFEESKKNVKERYNMEIEQILGFQNMNVEQYKEQLKENVLNQCRDILIVNEIRRIENFEVLEEEIEEEYNKSALEQNKSLKEVKEMISYEDVKDFLQRDKAIKFLQDNNLATNKQVANEQKVKKTTSKVKK